MSQQTLNVFWRTLTITIWFDTIDARNLYMYAFWSKSAGVEFGYTMKNFLRWEGLLGEINQFEDMCRSVKFGVVDLEYFFV